MYTIFESNKSVSNLKLNLNTNSYNKITSLISPYSDHPLAHSVPYNRFMVHFTNSSHSVYLLIPVSFSSTLLYHGVDYSNKSFVLRKKSNRVWSGDLWRIMQRAKSTYVPFNKLTISKMLDRDCVQQSCWENKLFKSPMTILGRYVVAGGKCRLIGKKNLFFDTFCFQRNLRLSINKTLNVSPHLKF